jgi:hypothetical protein
MSQGQGHDPHHFHTVSKAYADTMKDHWEQKSKMHDHMAKLFQSARLTAMKKRMAEKFKPKGGSTNG